MHLKHFKIGLLAAALLLLAACGRITPENYNQLEAGMERQQVYSILGNPDDVSGGGLGGLTMSNEVWNGRKHRVRVSFVGDKVVTKSIEPVDKN